MSIILRRSASTLISTSSSTTLLLRSSSIRPLISSRSFDPLSQFHTSPSRHLDTERQTSSQPPPPDFPIPISKRPPLSSIQPSPSPPPTEVPHLRRKITSVDQLPKKFGANQIIAVPKEVQNDLESVLRDFNAPVRFAFAYGSGVFRQKGYDSTDKPLLDFIFAVSHPSHWHAINMQQNPHHYSATMRMMGSDAVAWMQEKGLGAEVWFNIEVEVDGKKVKYGVISVDAICRDMLDWETLYVAGRTQKPVRILHDDARVRLANQVNLASALRTALLLLPEEFTEAQLFETIAGLSYRGDFRMAVGENPNKVKNIVENQLESFRSLYGGLLKSFWKSVYVIGESPDELVKGRNVRIIRQDVSIKHRAGVVGKLPTGLKNKLMGHYERKFNLKKALGNLKDGESDLSGLEQAKLWEKVVADEEFLSMLDKSLGQIVGRPTFNQALKGILSAGPIRSLRYIGPKLRKKWWPKPEKKAIEAPSPPPSSS